MGPFVKFGFIWDSIGKVGVLKHMIVSFADMRQTLKKPAHKAILLEDLRVS